MFDPFCLDRTNECLWRGSQVIKLRPKAYAVLNQLVGHSGQLVTKEELLATVWPDTFVSDAVLKVTIRQLRDALDDDPKAPLYIETAHRRGYRFIGQLADTGPATVKEETIAAGGATWPPRQTDHYLPLGIVGRDRSLTRMRSWLEKTLSGERQIVFATGEAGIGKTALVDTFARYLAFDRNIRIGRGQCLEQYGTSEAYLPILEAIGRLCRQDKQVTEVLRAHAPLWLLQMPSLLSTSEREALSRELLGATRERMLREMSEALEALTANQPLVLILEDLHWSDSSTLDLIYYLATQSQPAQLMLIGTYRPVELIVRGHPLKAVKQELLAKQQCKELPLAYLSEEAISKYLSVRFPDNQFPVGLARLIRERTEGNPLFMVNAVDYLVTAGFIAKRSGSWDLVGEIEKVEVRVPDSIKQMIEKQIDHLEPEDQRTLEAASVAGIEFGTLAVAAGLNEPLDVVEARCDQLARRGQFIQDCGVQELPNGVTVGRYAFIHALYQNVLYAGLSTARCIELHRRIGERGEEVYGESVKQIAAELAMHFERGRDYKRAAKYHQQAADNAIRRFAYLEAVGLAQHGLQLIAKLPDTTERAKQELCLQLTLGVPLIATEGYAASSVGSAYLKARDLLHQIGDTPDVAEVLWGVWAFHTLRAELTTAREMAEEMLDMAERLPYSGLKMRGHLMMGVVMAHMGNFAPALEHADQALALYDPERYRDDVFYYAQNPRLATLCHAAWTLWFLGLFDQSLERMKEGLTLARELAEPHGLAHAFHFSAILHQLRREPVPAQQHAEISIGVSREHGLAMYDAHATVSRGWALAEQGKETEGIEQLRAGLAAHQATGAEVMCPHFMALLAEALGKAGQVDEGLSVLQDALSMIERTRERYYETELYRLRGKLLLTQSPEAAEECLLQSIKVAREQETKACELRAATDLARLYRNQNKQEEARSLLAPVLGWFTEGSEIADVREAQALLDELSSRKSHRTAF